METILGLKIDSTFRIPMYFFMVRLRLIIYTVIYFFIASCSSNLPEGPLENSIFEVSIKDKNYFIEKRGNGDLLSIAFKYPYGKPITRGNHEDNFYVIDNQFPNKTLGIIAKNINEAKPYCKSRAIYKYPTPGPEPFGTMDVISGKNISLSPNKAYALVKSNFGPFLLLNITTLKFENFCIGHVKHVAWSGNDLLAISIEAHNGISTGMRPDAILIYDIVQKQKQIVRYKGKEVESIKWLKNKENLAILFSVQSSDLNFVEEFFYGLGHMGTTYQDFFVETYHYKNKIRSKKALVEEKVGNGSGFIH